MRTVAAARQWWAAHRPKKAPAAGIFRDRQAADAAALSSKSLRIVRFSSWSLLLLAAAALAGAAAGFMVTQANDRRLAAERQMALRHALDDLRPIFGNSARFDAGALRFIELRSGLSGLRFDTDSVPDAGREVQSVQDAHGRIVGWFSWVPDRTLIRAMDWLWGLAGIIGVGLLFFGVMTARASLRLVGAFANNAEALRKLSSEDPLTGLPNQRVVIQSLDRALTRQGRGECSHVAFALIDLDGFREINETLGRAGGEQAMLAIAARLKFALPDAALLGRFEDDEFAAVAGGSDAGLADALAAALRAAFAEPIEAAQALHVSAAANA